MNKAFGELVLVIPDATTTPFLQCNTTVKVSKCHCVFHCTVLFEQCENSLNLPLEVLQMFLGKDVIRMCNENLKSVKNTLLFLENIDYIYNTKNVITSIKNNDQNF